MLFMKDQYFLFVPVAHRCIPAVFKTNSMYDVLQSGNSTVKLTSKDGDKITPNALAEATRYFFFSSPKYKKKIL